jgi:hypothetical protein
MQIHVMLQVTMTLAVLQGQAIKPLPTIEAKAPADVTAVGGLNDALGTLSQKVTACVADKRTVEDCRCGYPQELASVRKGYEMLIHQHPDWKDQLVSYQYVNKDGKNISGTLILQNLRRQLDTLKCD